MANLGKKGIFLTFIAISIIAAFIIIFTPSSINLEKDITIVKIRVSSINDYIVDLEDNYLEQTLQSSSTKTLISLIEYMEVQNSFLTNFDANFKEVLLQGTIGGTPIDDITLQDIMKDNTFLNWTSRIINVSKNAFNIKTSIAVFDINVSQTTPWFVDVKANMSITIESETANWEKNITIQTQIEIQNFVDPFYLVNTNGVYVNKIKKSDTKFDEWNTNKVKDFIRDGNYTHWQDSEAPNFLMRFENDITPSSCCGIESLVNPNNPAITDQDTSYTDYLYFSTTPDCISLDLFTVNEINTEFSDFKFDLDHLVLYNLSANAQRICPPP